MSQTTSTPPPPAPAVTVTPPAPTSSTATVWGAPVVSVLAYLVFLFAIAIAWLVKNNELLVTLCGMAGANATTVVSFWLGSSKGSQDKDATLAQQSTQLANMPPPGSTTVTSTPGITTVTKTPEAPGTTTIAYASGVAAHVANAPRTAPAGLDAAQWLAGWDAAPITTTGTITP